MFLSELTDKIILSGKTPKGVCLGVGVSLKNFTVKYLLCASSPTSTVPDFAISVAAVESVDENVRISKLRPLIPKNCARIFLGKPVYAFDGIYLGKVVDLALQNFTATHLFTDQNIRYPMSAVTACFDAVLLKREEPYPIGQRIPAPLLYVANEKNAALVTKPVLRSAMQKGALIRLTLSLPPFQAFDLP